ASERERDQPTRWLAAPPARRTRRPAARAMAGAAGCGRRRLRTRGRSPGSRAQAPGARPRRLARAAARLPRRRTVPRSLPRGAGTRTSARQSSLGARVGHRARERVPEEDDRAGDGLRQDDRVEEQPGCERRVVRDVEAAEVADEERLANAEPVQRER